MLRTKGRFLCQGTIAVSYTHLEKMFTVSGGTVASSGSMLAVVSLVLGAVTGEFLDIERRLEPVSYTHLDVYKRQQLDSGEQM